MSCRIQEVDYVTTVSMVAVRQPQRLDFARSFPRLIAGADSSASPDAKRWRAQAELILNAAGEGIYGLDLHGCCTFVNPAAARMTGHSIEELLGQSMHDVVHHSHGDREHYPREECPIYAAFADGMIRNVCDEVFWRKDGSCFPVDYTSTPIFDDGKLIGAVVVFRDISIRHQTEERLRRALSEVERLKEQLQRENTSLRQEIESARGFQQIVGNSAVLREMMHLVTRFAATDSSVLIAGETGSGKELVARYIHRLSQRREGPLVRVNCAAISTHLADSELFGHEKGAFTGAVSRRAGRFEQAEGGTLFLDEVGELTPETQSKLLRVLQEREFERVGGNDTLTANVRVIAATNRDLRSLVKQGRFRADLYFRLNVVPIFVAPLRERISDIPRLVDHFLSLLEVRLGRGVGRVSDRGLARLREYHWPGNVRELQNVIERAAILSDDATFDIPDTCFAFAEDQGLVSMSSPEPLSAAWPSGQLPATQLLPPSASVVPIEAEAVEAPPQTMEQVERQHILSVLAKTHWRLSGPAGAGAVLGLHPNTLRHRMKKLGIER